MTQLTARSFLQRAESPTNASASITAATLQEALAFVKQVFDKTGLSKWITKVKPQGQNTISCSGKTKAGEVDFDFDLKQAEGKVFLNWRYLDGLTLNFGQDLGDFDLLDNDLTGIKSVIFHTKKLEKGIEEIDKVTKDVLSFAQAFNKALAQIAEGKKKAKA